MRKSIYLIALTFSVFMVWSCDRTTELKVMSFNIRFDNPADSLNNWQYRKDVAAQTILDSNADIIGTQEVLRGQLSDLSGRLTGYEYIGVGREDGDKLGEHCALFYKGYRFELLSWGNFWLSETPGQPGKGWDAACNRVATWAVLKEKKGGRELFVINTHLDHQGREARREGVNLLVDRIAEYSGGRPVILTGDFNAEPDSEVIKYVTEQCGTLFDTRELAKDVAGNLSTFHGFGNIPAEKREIIDYIFVGAGIETERFEILPEIINDTYVSDHNPIIASLRVR